MAALKFGCKRRILHKGDDKHRKNKMFDTTHAICRAPKCRVGRLSCWTRTPVHWCYEYSAMYIYVYFQNINFRTDTP